MKPLSQDRKIHPGSPRATLPDAQLRRTAAVPPCLIGAGWALAAPRSLQRFCLALAVMLFASAVCAAHSDAIDKFDLANRLYEQGKYPEAIAAYQELARADEVSSALYFNLANALFKDGQTGQAIYHYRLAQRLAPRDPDIRANLRFARESLPNGARRASRMERWLNLLSPNELTLIAGVALWIFLLLLAVGQFRRDWSRSLRFWRRVLGFATVVSVAWLGVLLWERLGSPAAVVIAKEATVRYGPFEEAQSSHTFQDGTELAILDRKDRWLQVTDNADRTGWLREEDVAQLPRG